MALGQVPSPDEFLPHQLGEAFTPHHLLVDYFEKVAKESDQVKLIEYGRTEEGRPLILAFISSKENLEQLEAIRHNHLVGAGIEEGQADPTLDRAIVWLSYSVHGNEAAGSESSMGVLYELLKGESCERCLDNTIVIIDPSLNPDGYSRYTSWYNATHASPADPDPNSREHFEPWPGGRSNHYLHDLNRDWAWQTQIESKQRMQIYRQWMPHVHADLHEQFPENHYYFAPAASPYHEYITDWQAQFQIEIGKNHAKYFDKNGWLYFTGEAFDLLYPSYGDTWPTFNGSIGMTYEQAGHGKAGLAIKLENGDTLTLKDRIDHHLTTSLSTVEMASLNAERLITNFESYFENNRNNPPGKYKSYIIKVNHNKDQLKGFLELLNNNGIHYGIASASSTMTGYDFATRNANVTVKVEEGDVVISAYQTMGLLAQVLLDPEVLIGDEATYDITAWSLPYAYGLETYAVKGKVDYNNEAIDVTNTKNMEAGRYGYAFHRNTFEDAHLLAALHQKGLNVRMANKSFKIKTEIYELGSIVVLQADNRLIADFHKKIEELNSKFGNKMHPLASGWPAKGPNFGSANYVLLKAPRVAVLSGENVGVYSLGELWYYFEQQLGYPISIISVKQLNEIDKSFYDVVIMPEGRYNLSFKQKNAISEWVADGGRWIAIGRANSALSGKEEFSLKVKTQVMKEAPEDRHYGDREKMHLDNYNPGVIIKVDLDSTHPLSYGLGQHYYSLKTNDVAFYECSACWNVGTIGDEAKMAGHMGKKVKEKLLNSTQYMVEDIGKGNIVYFADNPLFRSFWEQGNFLFSNALFLAF